MNSQTNGQYLKAQEYYLSSHAEGITTTFENNYIALHNITIVDSDADIEVLDRRIDSRRELLNDLPNPVTLIHPAHIPTGADQDPSFHNPRIKA